MTLIWPGKRNTFVANNVNKQQFIILMNQRLEAASIKTFHAKCDADVRIVLKVVTKCATNKATTLIGDYMDYTNKNSVWNIYKTKDS